MTLTPPIKAENERYLQTGHTDPYHEAWTLGTGPTSISAASEHLCLDLPLHVSSG